MSAPGSPLAGIFVGGASTRMGGAPKGLLRADGGETIIARWARLLSCEGAEPVLVGAHGAYAGLGLPALADARPDLGPLGGLLSLLDHAGERRAIAVACDMPRVTDLLVRRLLEAPAAPIVAARTDDRWLPFFARFDPEAVLPRARAHADRGILSLQRLLDAAGAVALPISPGEERLLVDWDRPEDVGS